MHRLVTIRSFCRAISGGDVPDASNPQGTRPLSPRDTDIHKAIGEKNFTTLTNAESIKDRTIGTQLRQKFTRRAGGDALKSSLDRIRRAKDYLSRGRLQKNGQRESKQRAKTVNATFCAIGFSITYDLADGQSGSAEFPRQ